MSEQVDTSAIDNLVASGAAPSKEYVDQNQGVSLKDVNPQKAEGPKRPDHIPEKFWDAEKGQVRIDEMAKSYSELEKGFSSKKPEDKPTDTPKADEQKPEDNSLKIEAEKANPLTQAIEKVATDYAQKGEVAPEDIEALAKQGLPESIIKTYLQGIKAIEAQTASEAAQIVGSKEQLDTIREWAKTNLTDAELDYYNKSVDDPISRKVALEWLNSKYLATKPRDGKLVNNQGVVNTGVSGEVFTNTTDLTAAMKSPRYQTDPAFRQEIAEKISRSKRAGTFQALAEYYRE